MLFDEQISLDALLISIFIKDSANKVTRMTAKDCVSRYSSMRFTTDSEMFLDKNRTVFRWYLVTQDSSNWWLANGWSGKSRTALYVLWGDNLPKFVFPRRSNIFSAVESLAGPYLTALARFMPHYLLLLKSTLRLWRCMVWFCPFKNNICSALESWAGQFLTAAARCVPQRFKTLNFACVRRLAGCISDDLLNVYLLLYSSK